MAEVTSGEIFRTINERLSYMEDVALYKALNYLAIEDVQREKIVINNAIQRAHEHGFKQDVVKAFFSAQISVAKAIQYRYRADLLSKSIKRQPLDLQKEVRPALIRLGNQLIQQMDTYCKNQGRFKQNQFFEFNQAITVNYLTTLDKQQLFNALLEVRQ